MGLLAVVALVVAACAALPPQRTDTGGALAESYLLNGVGPGGVEYSGILEVSATDSPSRFDLQWIVTGAVLEGSGVLEGDQLEAEWYTVEDPTEGPRGVVVYTVMPDGELQGARTVAGSDGVFTETAVPVK